MIDKISQTLDACMELGTYEDEIYGVQKYTCYKKDINNLQEYLIECLIKNKLEQDCNDEYFYFECNTEKDWMIKYGIFVNLNIPALAIPYYSILCDVDINLENNESNEIQNKEIKFLKGIILTFPFNKQKVSEALNVFDVSKLTKDMTENIIWNAITKYNNIIDYMNTREIQLTRKERHEKFISSAKTVAAMTQRNPKINQYSKQNIESQIENNIKREQINTTFSKLSDKVVDIVTSNL